MDEHGGGREMVVRSVALRGRDTGARLGPEWSGAGSQAHCALSGSLKALETSHTHEWPWFLDHSTGVPSLRPPPVRSPKLWWLLRCAASDEGPRSF